MTPRNQLYVMLKEPRPGRVKTRLGATIGLTSAAWWFRHQSARLLREVSRDPRWQVILAVSPDVAGMASRVWPFDLPRIAQGEGDLGARMGRILRNAPPGPRLIIGGDIPDITRARISGAFGVLRSSDVVFGPATDGGYWLIGASGGSRPLPAAALDDVRWSSRHALADSVAGFKPLRVGYADTLKDVDHAEDL